MKKHAKDGKLSVTASIVSYTDSESDRTIFMPTNVDDIVWQNDDMRFCVVKQGRYMKLFDATTGKWLLQGNYDEITFVDHSWAIVKVIWMNRVGFFSEDLTLVNNIWYDEVMEDEFAYIVKRDDKASVLPYKTGRHAKWYDSVSEFILDSNTKAFFKEGNYWGIIDFSGRIIHPPIFEEWKSVPSGINEKFAIKRDGLWAIMSDKCEWFCDFEYFEVRESPFDLKTIFLFKDGLQTLLIESGKIFELKYVTMIPHRGLFIEAKDSNHKVGILDKEGNCLWEPQFNSIAYMNDGIIAVRKGELYGFINLIENLLVEPQFKKLPEFHFNENGIILAQLPNDKYVFVKNDGTILTEEFDYADFPKPIYPFSCVGKIVKRGVFRRGTMIYAYISKNAELVTDFCFSRAITYKNEETTNIDLCGKKCLVRDYIKIKGRE